ncbi:DUF4249 domain-containing protein [Siphonobacter aquaeclarae]|uniref:DUF4249 domain-containing protein n=1 Tax=Siphonobacter aquaeclarae TaxID=563176 RepID=A0A1G9W7W2_9BACT|nr:DUF4249 domain-containing protein [Siphonobacter aquaeclarae]SDM80612.1 protein of unknown function [Siphonobacter aquaeclarae]
MKKALFFSALSLIATLSSCVKDSSDVLVATTPKLVVESYLNPADAEISVLVNGSRPIDGAGSGDRGNVNPVKNATVLLSNGTKEVTLLSAGTNVYKIAASALPLRPGQTYTLKVSAAGYPATDATCTIPKGISEPESVDGDLQYTLTDAPSSTYTVYRKRTMKWSPSETGRKYYMVGSGEGSVSSTRVNGRDSVSVRLSNMEVVAFLHDDSNTSYTTPQLAYPVGKAKADKKLIKGVPVFAFAYQVDRNYYEFFRTAKLQREVGDNPFAEAVPVFTNIRNGLGVFGAYVARIQRL